MSVDKLTPVLIEEIKSIYAIDTSLFLPIIIDTSKDIVYEKFKKLLLTAFDVPDTVNYITYMFTQRDLLWLPTYETTCNYYQLASMKSTREPTMSLVSYLFDSFDPHFKERYILTPEEINDRKILYERIRRKYTDSKQYLQRVARVLLSPFDIEGYYERLIQRVVFDIA